MDCRWPGGAGTDVGHGRLPLPLPLPLSPPPSSSSSRLGLAGQGPPGFPPSPPGRSEMEGSCDMDSSNSSRSIKLSDWLGQVRPAWPRLHDPLSGRLLIIQGLNFSTKLTPGDP